MEREPPLYPGDDFFLTAFYELSTCRALGAAGAGPIPWDKTAEYADRKGLEPDVADAFVAVIREMDGAYLKWLGDDIKRKGAKIDPVQRPGKARPVRRPARR